jgi:hypothetical protein
MSYREIYAPASGYVHGSRPDDDLELLPNGTVVLRPLMTTDADRLGRILTAVVIRLRAILLIFVTGQPVGDALGDPLSEAVTVRAGRDIIRIENAFHGRRLP